MVKIGKPNACHDFTITLFFWIWIKIVGWSSDHGDEVGFSNNEVQNPQKTEELEYSNVKKSISFAFLDII